MTYYLDIFSPETFEVFSNSERNITGFRRRQLHTAERIHPGDKLICYMTKLSRWVGILDVLTDCFIDEKPWFYEEDDPFVVRFQVKPIAWLDKVKTIPIREDHVWNTLTFTKGHDKGGSTWTGKFRSSLTRLEDDDGKFLEKLIVSQNQNGATYSLDEDEYQKLITQRVRREDRVVSVSVPEDTEKDVSTDKRTIRESTKIQALLAQIGERMGFSIWIPQSDRLRVLEEWKPGKDVLLARLPLNYDLVTLRTIEQIDVLWLKKRAIARAFEVEHTTAVYSGILRMADLLALQPNMDIKLHIVAPYSRREKVFQELLRPVFSLLDKGPLSEICTFISYDSVDELASQKLLAHLSDSVFGEYEEVVE